MIDGQKPNKPLFSQHYLEHRIQPPDISLGVNLGWPEVFFTETAGVPADDESFFRHPQGDYELRDR